jgi:hypothetical protein
MSKMTDRLVNQNIVNIAKQQYENQQKSKLPSVIVPLASAGKLYPKDHILHDGKVEMRYMTAYDEDILTNVSYIQNGVVFDKLLQSILLTPVDVKDIAVADKFGLIINARILAYGSDYAVTVTNPKTGNQIERVIDLNTIKLKPFLLQPNDLGEFEYQINDTHTIYFCFPTNEPAESTISSYLAHIITQVNDSRNKSDIENFIKYEFLALDSKKFRSFVLENTPGLDLNVEFEGEDGETFSAGFPLDSKLFWF